ncbi:conserved hypothetical protein [Methanocella arvoryzae MRE50]|uniref:NurA domain-containing protein n=2 Tax=Methanocella TaxID=570266 RepID=Q0W174_METAR|nr:conserved hypothetical protein [Methanocella arvoryzae MRE50]
MQEISDSRDQFMEFDADVKSVCEEYRAKLPVIDSLDSSINTSLRKYSGCKVLEEGAFVRRFMQKFESRQQATDWALETLKGTTIGAVDGSQIFPSPALSMPVGLAQACTVTNGHTGKNSYSTTSMLKLMTPAELKEAGGYAYAQSPVSLKRFEMEYGQIVAFTEAHPGNVVFMDGSLVLSFITQMNSEDQTRYIDAVGRVMEASERNKSPVVAYTDMSMSQDLITMMRLFFKLTPTSNLTDAFVIKETLNWGDRTRAFLCDRDDRMGNGNPSVLDLYGKHRDSIAFFYLNASGALPSKVEVPVWCVKEGLLDRITDIIRAECIIRPGYPDIIHRAHEYATINNAESGLFESVIDSMARKHKLNLFKSAKELNKHQGV